MDEKAKAAAAPTKAAPPKGPASSVSTNSLVTLIGAAMVIMSVLGPMCFDTGDCGKKAAATPAVHGDIPVDGALDDADDEFDVPAAASSRPKKVAKHGMDDPNLAALPVDGRVHVSLCVTPCAPPVSAPRVLPPLTPVSPPRAPPRATAATPDSTGAASTRWRKALLSTCPWKCITTSTRLPRCGLPSQASCQAPCCPSSSSSPSATSSAP